jgi:rod shape-determining protein MreC
LAAGRLLKPVNDLALTTAAPFAAVVSGASAGLGDLVSGVVQGPELQSDVRRLERQNGRLTQEIVLLQQAKYENALLSRMLNFDKANNRMDFVPSRVIGTDPNGLAPDLIIQHGTDYGLRQGMTVVDASGYFVGSISELTRNAAKVLLMTNPSSTVDALDLETHAHGAVEGRIGASPELRFVPTKGVLRPGDIIVTSGQLNLFPRNIVLGQVARVSRSNDALFQTAEIRPAADFQNLEIVQIIRNFVPSEPVHLITDH